MVKDQGQGSGPGSGESGSAVSAGTRELLLIKSMLGAVSEGIVAMSPQGELLFHNHTFCQQFGISDEEMLSQGPRALYPRIREQLKDPQALEAIGEQTRAEHGDAWQGTLEFHDGRVYEVVVRQLWEKGEHLGRVWLVRDITEQRLGQKALEVSESNLREVVRDQERLLATIREIGTPVLPIYNRILVLPLVGHIDTSRTDHLMDELLDAIQRHQASVVIIDITGVSLVDTSVANSLIQSTQAAALLGAHCVLVGISAAVARTIVQLGVDLSQMTTRRDLQAGIAFALHHLGYAIKVTREEPDWLVELDPAEGEAAAATATAATAEAPKELAAS